MRMNTSKYTDGPISVHPDQLLVIGRFGVWELLYASEARAAVIQPLITGRKLWIALAGTTANRASQSRAELTNWNSPSRKWARAVIRIMRTSRPSRMVPR